MTQPLKYALGETLWVARVEPHQVEEVCPDCGGTKFITVTLFDGTVLTPPCETCKRQGYPTGKIKRLTYGPIVKPFRVDGFNVWPGSDPEYRQSYSMGACWTAKESELFREKEAAEVRALEVAAQMKQEEEERLQNQKEKPNRNWAWHVTYYRREIRRAQETITRATAQLHAATTKAKEA